MKLVRIGLFTIAIVVGLPAMVLAENDPPPSESNGQAPTPPTGGPNSGTEPGGSGSTGWTGGTGGSNIGTTPSQSNASADPKSGPTSQTAPGQPEVVQGVNPDSKN